MQDRVSSGCSKRRLVLFRNPMCFCFVRTKGLSQEFLSCDPCGCCVNLGRKEKKQAFTGRGRQGLSDFFLLAIDPTKVSTKRV